MGMDEQDNFDPLVQSSTKSRRYRPWIGAHIGHSNELHQEYGKKYGPVVLKVIYGGPAYHGRFRENDTLLKVDNIFVGNADEFLRCIRSHSVGETISVLIRRNNEELTVKIEIGTDGLFEVGSPGA